MDYSVQLLQGKLCTMRRGRGRTDFFHYCQVISAEKRFGQYCSRAWPELRLGFYYCLFFLFLLRKLLRVLTVLKGFTIAFFKERIFRQTYIWIPIPRLWLVANSSLLRSRRVYVTSLEVQAALLYVCAPLAA